MGSGGAERVISILSNSFVNYGHGVSIIMLSKEATESFYKLDEKIKVLKLTNSRKKVGVLTKTKLLRKLLLKSKPDIVISFLSYVCIYTWLALRHTKIPYIVSERNDPNQRGTFKQYLLNCSFRNASGCVFQTEDALEWYKKVAKGKSLVIHNPVHLDYLPSKISKRNKQILYVGRFTDQKNCLMLLDSFNLFIKKHPEYSLKLYGSGSLETEIKQKILNLNLTEKVTVLQNSKTWQKDEYNSAMFVLPSKYEGMPNVLAEALCLGIPSVSTNCTIGGPKELKKFFKEGLVLSGEINAQSIFESMEACLKCKAKESFIPKELQSDFIVLKWLSFLKDIKKL